MFRYDELRRHSWVHTDTGRAQCEWCHKTFNRLDHFKVSSIEAMRV